MKRKKHHPDYWDDVPDEWKETIDRMYLEEYNSDRAETRRHQSLDKSKEHGFRGAGLTYQCCRNAYKARGKNYDT